MYLLGNKYLLDDQGYKGQTNLLTPYLMEETLKKELFNILLSQTRVKIECVFGQLKWKFACLSKRPDLKPNEIVDVVQACVFYGTLVSLLGTINVQSQEIRHG